MTVSDQPLAALCNVRPAKIEIDLDDLFSSASVGRYVRQQHSTWRNLRLRREEHVEQTRDRMKPEATIKGSISVDGGSAEEAYFTLRDVPSSGLYGSIIVLDCHFGEPGDHYFVVVTKINPYGCRDTEENIVLPYVASVHPRVSGDGHPLGDDGIARQMIINRHYGIS